MVLRNFIEITGITPEEDFPVNMKDKLIVYSESDYLFIPSNKLPIKTINGVDLKLEIKSYKVIDYKAGRLIVLDGIKKIKIIYDAYKKTKERTLVFELPYNTFFELTEDINYTDYDKYARRTDIYIADAYFNLINSKKIYSHIVYMINP